MSGGRATLYRIVPDSVTSVYWVSPQPFVFALAPSKAGVLAATGNRAALYRLEREGWIDAEWGTSELGRKARLYKLTPLGRKQLRAEVVRFAKFVSAVQPILLGS